MNHVEYAYYCKTDHDQEGEIVVAIPHIPVIVTEHVHDEEDLEDQRQ